MFTHQHDQLTVGTPNNILDGRAVDFRNRFLLLYVI